VRYELTDDGLLQRVRASNIGSDPAPWGTGPHPYLVAGEGRVDDWTLELPASKVLEVTADRLLPVGVADVAAHDTGAFDFREERQIHDVFIDHAFTSLLAVDGTVTVRVHAKSGDGVEMSWHESLPWVQIHTADQPDPARHRLGLAVEPMTCPPDAFNSEVDLIVLAPGESSSAEWTIRAVNPQH
jgi:aldose 1-epimerase